MMKTPPDPATVLQPTELTMLDSRTSEAVCKTAQGSPKRPLGGQDEATVQQDPEDREPEERAT